MKKVFLFILLFSLFASVCAFAGSNHIFDDAGYFNKGEINELNQVAETLLKKTGTDLIIITTYDSQGFKPERFAAEYYEDMRPYKEINNYVAFAFCFDIGKYGEASYGPAKSLLAHESDDTLYSVLEPYLPDKDYFGAMLAYMDYLEDVLIPPTKSELYKDYITFTIIASLVIGGITVFIMSSSMKRKKFQSDAQQYVVPHSLNLTQSNDIFLYRTETRTKIEREHSSGGGSSNFNSSSGRSYGGRSGSL